MKHTVTRHILVKFVFPLIIALSFLSPGSGYSQETDIAKYPNRPITFIVPVPPGGGPDLSVRLIAKEVERILGQSIVIVNKPGGSMAKPRS